jgi:miniconductance mechanosensitive channel
MQWDDVIARHGVLSRLAHVVPALVVMGGIALVRGLPPFAHAVVRSVAVAYIVLTVVLAFGRLLDALNELYESRGPRAQERPVKGYLQLL